MHVIDTNVLVYAANEDAPESLRCRALLASWRAGPGPWGTTWSVLYEFLRVATHPRVFATPWTASRAWTFVEGILRSSAFSVIGASERHPEVAARTLAEVPLLCGNDFHDMHIAVVMREHGIRQIWTRDTGFHRFPFLEVIDPMAADGPGKR